jgi:NADPH:quinone reductase-like Zn-dependent oxidoreductase
MKAVVYEKHGSVDVLRLAETGRIRPVIDRCYPLEQAADAYRYVEQGHRRGMWW